MRFESNTSRRISIERAAPDTVIVVRARMNAFILVMAVFWLGFCTFVVAESAEDFSELMSAKTEGVVLAVLWLGMVIGSLIFAIAALLWVIWGRETLVVSNTSLTKRVSIPLLSRDWHYDPAHLANFRMNQVQRPMFSWSQFDNPLGKQGLVAFDYGQKTITVGLGLDDAEAELIVNTLKNQYEQRSEAA